MTDLSRARALLAEASRLRGGALKRLAAQLDGDLALRSELATAARAAGAELPDDADGWPAKKLLRRALAREDAAQVRRNPIARDEAFVCAHCGAAVPPHGRTARDHCPACLRSAHVDVVPGDRASDCGGVLHPVGLELRGDRAVIAYRCERCGAARRNRVLDDGEPPDDPKAVRALSAGTPR